MSSYLLSDHNTQQTHTNNRDSDAEEDIQVREQKLMLCVNREVLVSVSETRSHMVLLPIVTIMSIVFLLY